MPPQINRSLLIARRSEAVAALGQFIVADPEICHGKPTFIGTRIMVSQVVKQVARGMTWGEITAEWRGSITRDAIAEAIEMAVHLRTNP